MDVKSLIKLLETTGPHWTVLLSSDAEGNEIRDFGHMDINRKAHQVTFYPVN